MNGTAAFAIATAWSYGAASAAYAAFAIQVSLASRKQIRARLLLFALVMMAVWAASCVWLGLGPGATSVLASSSAEALRYGAWFLFLGHVLSRPDSPSVAPTLRNQRRWVVLGVVFVLSVIVWSASALEGLLPPRLNYLLRLSLAILGLILVEQLVRRVMPQRRWAIKPLAIALGGLFGLDLYFYADAILYGGLDPEIWVARGFASILVVPLIAISSARNTGWSIDLHISRGAIYQSSALLISGAFLLLVAGGGYLVRYTGGDWGRALQIELIFAACLLVVLFATSGRFRAKLKVFISKHFFSYRYDYREEWLRFTRTLSNEASSHSLQVRSVAALANLVESPAGVLWLAEEARGFVPVARWNMPAPEAVEPRDGPLASFIVRTGWVIDVTEFRRDPSRYDGLELPAWVAASASCWLILPLAIGAELLGFVVLTSPRTPVEVNWEVRDLLKTASRQAASHLAQDKATEALVEARKFDAFNRMSAFVVHDLKNLIAQLSLMLKNANRHRNNPAFQADMLATVEHVVDRMNALMLQLRTGAKPVERAQTVDVSAVVRRVCTAKSTSAIPIDVHSLADVSAVCHADRLEHVIGHLVQNAIDASPPAGRVGVSVEAEDRYAIITVSDAGAGMAAEFMRQELFKPFRTTKDSGMGIGVYESAQYVSQLGGEISFHSEPGKGTVVRLRLPRVAPAVAHGVEPVREQA